MCNYFTARQVNLRDQLRMLWEQHVYWTRFFIISTAASLGDLPDVTNRLLQNPGDFGAALTPFYGARVAGQFQELLREHLLIGGDLVTAAKNQDPAKVDEDRTKWYENAAQIARFLGQINPCWSESKWQTMLDDHLAMTEQEAMLRLAGRYPEDIRMFDRIEAEALEMADYMTEGMTRQFCL